MITKPFRHTMWRRLKDECTDSYGKAIVGFSERLADLLEKDIGDHKKVTAYDTLKIRTNMLKRIREANTEHISADQYLLAITLLSQVWAFGDELVIIAPEFEEV